MTIGLLGIQDYRYKFCFVLKKANLNSIVMIQVQGSLKGYNNRVKVIQLKCFSCVGIEQNGGRKKNSTLNKPCDMCMTHVNKSY